MNLPCADCKRVPPVDGMGVCLRCYERRIDAEYEDHYARDGLDVVLRVLNPRIRHVEANILLPDGRVLWRESSIELSRASIEGSVQSRIECIRNHAETMRLFPNGWVMWDDSTGECWRGRMKVWKQQGATAWHWQIDTLGRRDEGIASTAKQARMKLNKLFRISTEYQRALR